MNVGGFEMPAAFESCVKTINGPDKRYGLAKGEYLHVCLLKGNWYRGEVKKKQSKKGEN